MSQEMWCPLEARNDPQETARKGETQSYDYKEMCSANSLNSKGVLP